MNRNLHSYLEDIKIARSRYFLNHFLVSFLDYIDVNKFKNTIIGRCISNIKLRYFNEMEITICDMFSDIRDSAFFLYDFYTNPENIFSIV